MKISQETHASKNKTVDISARMQVFIMSFSIAFSHESNESLFHLFVLHPRKYNLLQIRMQLILSPLWMHELDSVREKLAYHITLIVEGIEHGYQQPMITRNVLELKP